MDRKRVALAAFLASAVALLWLDGTLGSLFAQTGPFGVPRPQAPPPPADGFMGWLLAKQAEFYRALRGTILAAKTDGSAVITLFGIAFLYGVFHAAGPGHGKAVISSYVVANQETWRRGVVLSFASALVQALVAIAIVGVAAALLQATAKTMCGAAYVIEVISYALIAALGAWLVWVKGRAFMHAWGVAGPRPVAVGAAVTPHPHEHEHEHHHHHDHHHHHHPHHHDGHDHAGHSHGPEPQELAGPGGWKRGLAAVFAVGMRPCSGAIVILVFTLANGLFWAGVGATLVMALGTAITVAALATLAVTAQAVAKRLAATRAGRGTLLLRGIEVAAAALVLAFGVLLLVGYLVAERLTFC
jgi:ABC-type nickel/cobalt efflux system permease component RcnA